MVLGAVLGTGCSEPNGVEYGPAPAEYGMPTGTIRISGRVVDGDSNPVPGIAVSFSDAPADTTGADGNWRIEREQVFMSCVMDQQSACVLEAEDVDCPDNGGSFQPAQVGLDLVQTESGDGRWDQGTWEQHDIEIVVSEEREPGTER